MSLMGQCSAVVHFVATAICVCMSASLSLCLDKHLPACQLGMHHLVSINRCWSAVHAETTYQDLPEGMSASNMLGQIAKQSLSVEMWFGHMRSVSKCVRSNCTNDPRQKKCLNGCCLPFPATTELAYVMQSFLLT